MYKLFINTLGLLFITLIVGSCLVAESTFTRVAPGPWRGILELERISFPVHDKDTVFQIHEQFKEGELPFNFEVTYTDELNFYVELINGDERIKCDSIDYGRDRSQARDTFNIHFPEYQSYLHAEVRGRAMQGYWKVLTKENYQIPFHAIAGEDFRFTTLKKTPARDISGQWAAYFGVDKNQEEKAIGEFVQNGNQLSGTFRTEVGDYRYLDGTIQGNKFWLSCFDGSHAFLFSGKINGDSLSGEFRSGSHYRTLWTAWQDPNFELGDPDTLSRIRTGAAPIQFSLPATTGENLEFPGPYFDNKISIITIMGTWCPNCKDEEEFLTQYLKDHPDQAKHIAVASIGFERNKEPDAAIQHLALYQKRMGIPFAMAYGGEAKKELAEQVFPALDHVLSFPTMLILDRNQQVRFVHTGFSGPATSKYTEFKSEFEHRIAEMLAEK